MNVADLVSQARRVLTNKPALGGSICVDFGSDGVVYIYANNQVSQLMKPAGADCELALSLDTLGKLQSRQESVVGAVLWGDLKISGNRALAEKFGAIVKGAKP